MSGMGAQFLAKHKALQEENENLRDQVAQLREEIKGLKDVNREQERQVTELSQGKELLGKDIERVRGQLGEAKEALDAGAQDNAKLKALESRVELLQNELDETFASAKQATRVVRKRSLQRNTSNARQNPPRHRQRNGKQSMMRYRRSTRHWSRR
ncbi:hypothetical protein CIHG_07787 [Coccidioides immitis H538.4]|uniref:Uncharacterized protein n=1 Tax=Coccidioides immitis H538.4 TaxID=396776 RepID=A0A0J8S033_COCIT|nr:hypothetical protein CIHG_07787 [Coccidioides immitis H538.4]